MDDVHFILRHAMTGAVFVIFSALTFAIIAPADALALLQSEPLQGEALAGTAALAIIAFPMIGITIQGAYFSVHTMISGSDWFEDPARKYVAKKVRLAIKECRDCASVADVVVDWESLAKAPDDAFFVWLYHHRATPYMIEWARRRRSYYYLGWNWVLAAATGVIAAHVVQLVDWNSQDARVVLIGLGLAWAGGALWAAERMRRDADTMEAIWAASQIDPRFRECLATRLPAPEMDAVPLNRAAPRAIEPAQPVPDPAIGSAPPQREKRPPGSPRAGARRPLKTEVS